jgi:cytochrome c-type biogenesis protein CcmH/NrfG
MEQWLTVSIRQNQSGPHGAAISQLNEAVRLDPNNVTALYRLGQAGAALGLNSDAIKHLRRAADLGPERSEIAFLLATALFANSERQAGSETLERIRSVAPPQRGQTTSAIQTKRNLSWAFTSWMSDRKLQKE